MSSFFTKKEGFASDATTMAMKEMLFGALQSKDIMKKSIVHASDFRQAVAQMGIPMGHVIVEEILMHCKISSKDGSIDFSELELELRNQRKAFNESVKEEKKNKKAFMQTSQAFDKGPYDTHDSSQRRSRKQEQISLLTQYRQEIVEIFKDYAHHAITPDDVKASLSTYGIKTNRRFELLIEDHRSSDDLSFREFFTALGTYDPTEKVIRAEDRAAGRSLTETTSLKSVNAYSESSSEKLFEKPIRRSNHMSQRLQQDRSNNEGAFHGRRQDLFEDANPSGDKALYKDSSNVDQALKPGYDDPTQMLTHNKSEMMRGFTGEKNPAIKYTVEMKLQREQVLVALRRLDRCDIDVFQFERRLHDIGFEAHPSILKKITDSLKTGKLDWKATVKLLDCEIFHKRALELQTDHKSIERIKNLVSNCLKHIGGASGLCY